MAANQQMLSLSAVARKCDVTAPRASALVREKVWIPDAVAGRSFLFREDRLPELKAAVPASRNAA